MAEAPDTRQLELIYSAVARSLPVEGRDFNVDIEAGPDGGVRVVIASLSPLGELVVPLIRVEVTRDLQRFLAKPPAQPRQLKSNQELL